MGPFRPALLARLSEFEEECRQEGGAAGEVGGDDLLVPRVGAVSERAEPVKHRHTQPGHDVAVRTAARRAFPEIPVEFGSQLPGALVEGR